MLSSYKHRRDCFPQNALYIALQGEAHNALEQIPKDTLPLCQLLLQQQYTLAEQKRIPLACCTEPLLSEAGELSTNSSSQAGSMLPSSCSTAWTATAAKMRGWEGKRTVPLPSTQGQENWFGGNKAIQDGGGERLTFHLLYLPCSLHPEIIPLHCTLLEALPKKTREKLFPVTSMPWGWGTQQKDGSCNLVSSTA